MRPRATTSPRRKAAALIIVLWTVVLLSVILTNFAFLVRTHTRIASNFADASVLSGIARGGVERAIITIKEDKQTPDTLTEFWSDNEKEFKEAPLGDGNFSLIRHVESGEVTELRYGIEDEASRINLRTATREMLVALKLTEEQASAVLDWQDKDDDPQPQQGAEIRFYSELEEPYPCKNQPLDTLQELMRLRGFEPSVLYGEDWNQNGILDPNENDGDERPPLDDENGILERGLLPYVTLYSIDKEVNLADSPRVDINSADEAALKGGIQGLNDDEAKAIVQHRNEKKFENLGQLLQVREAKAEHPQPEGEKKEGEENKQPQENNNNEDNRKLIITRDRLKQIIDYCKIAEGETVSGRVNINTAPARVLSALPGISKQVADAIVQAREKERRTFSNIAEILDIPGMTDDDFIKASGYLTVRSYQFHVRSEGRIPQLRSKKTVSAVLDRSGTSVTIRYWNEQ